MRTLFPREVGQRVGVLGAVTLALFGSAQLLSAAATQRVTSRSLTLHAQTADSATIIARCVVRNADTVRATWSYPGRAVPSVALSPSRCVDTLHVAKGSTAQVASIAFAPKYRSSSGSVRTASLTIPARVVVAPPTIDSISIDTVGVSVPPEQPPSGGDLTPNLPAGLTRRGDTQFETLAAMTAQGLQLGDGGGGSTYRLVALNDAPWSATAFETTYPGNSAGDGVGGWRIMGVGGKRYTRLYESIRVCVPATYVVHTNGEKFVYMYLTNGSNGVAPSIVNWEIGDAGSATASTFALAAFPNLNTGRFEDWLHANGPGRMRKGRCQTVEMFWQMNTPRQHDGVLRIWIDGVVSHAYTNVWYHDDAGTGFDDVRHDGTRGGGASSVKTPASGQVRQYTRLIWYAQ